MTLHELQLAWLEHAAWAGLCAVRPLVMLSAMPATDDPVLTASTRFQVGVMVGLFVAHGGAGAAMPALGSGAFVVVLLREAFIGLLLALMAGRIFWVAQSVGALLDNLAGYNNVQLLNPSSPEQSTPLADLLLQLSSAVFLVLGGLAVLVRVLLESWRWWPVVSPVPVVPEGAGWLPVLTGEWADGLFRSIATVAMPLLFLLTLVDLGLALVSRANKGVDTSCIAAPVKAALALLGLVVLMTAFMDEVRQGLRLDEVFAVIRRFEEVWR